LPNVHRFFLKRFLFFFLAISIGLITLYFISVPEISMLKKSNPKKTSLMEYREKEWKRRSKQYEIRQIWVPLSSISPYVIKAVLIAEDDKFYRHEGFDYEAIKKAIEKDIKAGKFRYGGSTITQQLVKNLYLSPDKNLLRKLREALITWRIEKVLTKKRILELYLNTAEWGRGIFGVEAASRYYYEKPSSELSPEEASRLAAVLPNPIKYSPLGNSRYVTRRSDLIYCIMVRRGIVVPEFEEVVGEEGDGILTISPKNTEEGLW
jgi:monofunctional biosynthetic peptidoglycan transglycosylase